MGDDPLIGRDFAGWVLERKIGQGGMGSVYLGRRPGDAASAVVKFLAEEQAHNPTWRGRFFREARVMEQMQHEHIVAVHAVVDEAVPFIVMEFVDGEGLDARLEREGALPAAEAARVARDIARGLAYAHERNVIHRDIKPANVLLTRDGAVKVLDFGLAKSVASDDGLSLAGQVLGTPHYMAPEQWGDHQADARADVFALGASLYQLATGALPFQGESAQEISRRAHAADFVAPRALAPDLPEDLELVILRALVPDRQFRYQGAQALADDLQRVLDGAPVAVPCVVGPDGVRQPLLPHAAYTVGSAPTAGVQLADPSVAAEHATLTLSPAGWIVRDLGGGTAVGGVRTTRDVLLKDGDEVRFGDVACRFHDGGLGARLRSGAGDAPPTERAPAYVFEALVRLSDRRCVLALIEDLDRRPQQLLLEATRAELAPLWGEETAAAAAAALEKAQRRARTRLPAQLFTITHENLGDDVAAWLAWWEQAQAAYPGQVAAALPAGDAALRITQGEPEPRDALLPADRDAFTLGRDPGCDVVLTNRAVSRLHARIERLHRRLVLRDGGSRLGTLLNGERVQAALLESGDTIALGKVELVFGGAPPAAVLPGDDPEEDAVWVHPDVYLALEGLRHPSTVLASLRFLYLAADEALIAAGAARLFPDEQDRARGVDALTKVLHKRATEAGHVLTAVLGPDPGDWWQAAYEAACSSLPTQANPLGWFDGAGG